MEGWGKEVKGTKYPQSEDTSLLFYIMLWNTGAGTLQTSPFFCLLSPFNYANRRDSRETIWLEEGEGTCSYLFCMMCLLMVLLQWPSPSIGNWFVSNFSPMFVKPALLCLLRGLSSSWRVSHPQKESNSVGFLIWTSRVWYSQSLSSTTPSLGKDLLPEVTVSVLPLCFLVASWVLPYLLNQFSPWNSLHFYFPVQTLTDIFSHTLMRSLDPHTKVDDVFMHQMS